MCTAAADKDKAAPAGADERGGAATSDPGGEEEAEDEAAVQDEAVEAQGWEEVDYDAECGVEGDAVWVQCEECDKWRRLCVDPFRTETGKRCGEPRPEARFETQGRL